MRIGKKKEREICADCKGICCQIFACIYHPKDIRPFTVEHILYLIEEGAMIDFETFEWIAVLRPRRQGELQTSCATNETKFGACIHLTEKGCRLSYAERPREGRALKPRRDGNCRYPRHFRERLLKEWSHPRYQNILDQVLIEISPEAFVKRVDIKTKGSCFWGNMQLSEEEKEELKANLAKKRRRQKRNKICFGILIFAIIVFLIYFIKIFWIKF